MDVSAQSDEGLRASEASGFLGALFSELRGDDVLAQLNVLEMTTALALKQHSLVFLDQQGILDFLAQKLTNSSNDPLSSFLVPGMLTFLSFVSILNLIVLLSWLLILIGIFRSHKILWKCCPIKARRNGEKIPHSCFYDV